MSDAKASSSSEIAHPDGRVELTPEALARARASLLFNEDLAPVPVVHRW